MYSGRLSKFRKLQQESSKTGCSQRILSQLGFLLELSAVRDCRFDDTILPHIEYLSSATRREGAITHESVAQVEGHLSLLETEAKAYRVFAIVQPPMDPPVAKDPLVYIKQVRYALELLEKHTEIVYFEPRAAVYHLLATYQPDLLYKIIQWVEQGRWEVGVTGWNGLEPRIQSTESTLHNLIKNKEYLSRLLRMEEEDIQIHFEADAFGVSPKSMELLTTAELAYDYRYGCGKQEAFSIRTGNGNEILHLKGRNQETIFAGDELSLFISEFFRSTHSQLCLRVIELDVDHPQRTDDAIEHMKHMAEWPLFPTIEFHSMKEFFQALSGSGVASMEPQTWEASFSDIGFYLEPRDQWSLYKEQSLFDSFSLDAQAHMLIPDYRTAYSKKEMEEVRLQFPTCPTSLSLAGNIAREHAFNALCLEMDTSKVDHGSEKNTGFEQTDYSLQQSNNHHYPAENFDKDFPYLFTIFNTSQFEQKKVVEVEVPKWNGGTDLLHVMDSKGREVPSQVEQEHNGRVQISFLADLPQFGYATYRVYCEQEWYLEAAPYTPRCISAGGGERVVLENQYIRACFSMENMTLLSFYNKGQQKELVFDDQHAGTFELALRDDEKVLALKSASAYRIPLNLEYPVQVKDVFFGNVRCWIDYEILFGASVLSVRVVLDHDATALRWETKVKWLPETLPVQGKWILRFALPFQEGSAQTLYHTPWGEWANPNDRQVLLGAQGIAPLDASEQNYSIVLLAQGHHSLVRINQTLYANLITPEMGMESLQEDGSYTFRLGIGVGDAKKRQLLQQTNSFVHPAYCVKNSVHGGRLPAVGALMTLVGNVMLSHTWATEKGDGMYVRLYNGSFHKEKISLMFVRELATVDLVDYRLEVWETLHLPTRHRVELSLPSNGVTTIRVLFQ